MIHKVVDTAINSLFAIFIPVISKNKEILTALGVRRDCVNITGGYILEE
jgi:hypothetical protein